MRFPTEVLISLVQFSVQFFGVGGTPLQMCMIIGDVDGYLHTDWFVYFLVKGSVHPVTSINFFWNGNCHKWLMV